MVVLAGGTVALGGRSAPPAPLHNAPVTAAAEAVLLHPMDVITVRAETLRRTLPVSGTLHPHRQVQITSKAAGKVEAVHARLGQPVASGDLLLQVETLALKAQLEQQEAALEAAVAEKALAETQAQRSQRLEDRGVSATAAADTARSNLQVQAANLRLRRAAVVASEIALQDASVHAPFDGIIAAREVDTGRTVQNGDALFELADLSSMLVTANVPVARSVLAAPGQAVTLRVEGLDDREFTGAVEGIGPVASDQSRSAPVSVRVANPDGVLRGGMFVSGEIVLDETAQAIAIPRDSLRQDAEGSFVLKIGDGRLVRQPVEAGAPVAGNAVLPILSGLEDGDRIVSGRLPELRAGIDISLRDPS